MSREGRELSYSPHTGDCNTSGTAETARSAGTSHRRAMVGLPQCLKGTVHASVWHPRLCDSYSKCRYHWVSPCTPFSLLQS